MTSKAVCLKQLGLSDLRETAFLALTVVFGLQVLRVLLAELVFYIRDSLGAGSITPGVYALALFLLAFLAAPMYRRLGPRRALMLTGGGLALVRLAEQFVLWPIADLGLATVGTVLFITFVPMYIGHLRQRDARGGHTFAAGILLGIGVDTAIKGVFATLDLSWQPGVATYLLVIFLVGLQWRLLWSVARGEVREQHSDGGFLRSVPLVALGPILFLEALLFQNIGQQTALIDWDQPVVFIWVVMANAVGVVAAIGVMARPTYGVWLTLIALVGLFALLALGERSGLTAALVALFRQVAISMSVGMIGAALASEPTRPGIGGVAAASGLGMLLLLVLTFLYYVNYDFDIPGGSSVVPPIGVAIVFLCILGAIPALFPHPGPSAGSGPPLSHRERGRGVRVTAPAAVGALLLLIAPLGYMAAWDEPRPVSASGFPVRVMSYNLHQGFDVNGYLAIEGLADVIEAQEPDIIALQEVSRGWMIDGSFDMLVWLSNRLDMPYAWGPAADSVWGNAILSRYPMTVSRTQPMPNNGQLQLKRSFTIAEVDLGDGESLTVIGTHLHHKADEGHLREPQVRALLQEWDGEERSVVMGDLNALPDALEMLLMAEAGLKDAFQPSDASEMGYTAPSDDPAKRIDYIWVSSDLGVRDFSLTDSLASDHLGVAVTLDRSFE